MKRNQSGFTLIEIAIVLVIIGLLLGGVLKGQELINSAKVKNLATDFRNIPVFIYGYQDKYRALPGDDAKVVTEHLGSSVGASKATTPTTCNNGLAPSGGCVGNGVLDGLWSSTTLSDESQLFWQHIRLAGLAPGITSSTTDYRPTNSVGGAVGIQSGSTTANYFPIKDSGSNPIRGTYIICSEGIIGKFVKQLDIQMDDGNTATGPMMAVPSGSTMGTTATATLSVDDAATYTVCLGV
ncbi:MAG: prepilin-type N-terminal cleavage/methylation domain-containing protein [Gallionella sp.]